MQLEVLKPRVAMMVDNLNSLDDSDIDAVSAYVGPLELLNLPDRYYVEMFRVPKSVHQ